MQIMGDVVRHHVVRSHHWYSQLSCDVEDHAAEEKVILDVHHVRDGRFLEFRGWTTPYHEGRGKPKIGIEQKRQGENPKHLNAILPGNLPAKVTAWTDDRYLMAPLG